MSVCRRSGGGLEPANAEDLNLADRSGTKRSRLAVRSSTPSPPWPAPSAVGLPATFRTIGKEALDLGARAGASTVIDLHDLAIDHLQLDDPVRLRDFAEAVLGPRA